MSSLSNGSSGSATGLGNAMTSGSAGMGSGDNITFTMPDGSTASPSTTTTPDTAGLTGVQSGATLPDFSNSLSTGGGYSFNMPSGGNIPGALGNAMGTAQKIAQPSTQQAVRSAGGGKLTVPAKSFGSPVVALPMAAGSQAGNSLLQLLQNYRAGVAR